MKSIVQLLEHPQDFKQKQRTSVAFLGTLFAAPLVALTVAALSFVAPAHAAPLSQANRDFVDATINAAMAKDKIPGVSISVSGPAGSYTKAYGVSDLSKKTPQNVNNHFRIGSITKLFTAHAILVEVDKGTIKLDDTVDKYLQGIPNGNLITIRQLLSMRSGLYDYTSDFLFQVLLVLWPSMPYSPQSALNATKSHAPLFAPGTQYAYTNSNYTLLGFILEKVTGKTAAAAITDDVIKPLGLTETTFAMTSAMPAPFSRGYGPNPILSFLTMDYTNTNPNTAWTAGAIVSTLGDLTKYANALRTGALLTPATQAQRLQFCPVPYGAPGTPAVVGYGLGILSYGSWLGHNGDIPGFDSMFFYDPTTGAVITGMQNSFRGSFPIFTDILPKVANKLYPGSVTAPQYPTC